MLKIVLLADLHGNMTATLAVEKELERIEPDEVWFVGDAVGKGPRNDETCDWVRKHCQYHIGGNWDYGMSDKTLNTCDFYDAQLGQERIEWLYQLPRERELLISGVNFRVYHGRPVTTILQGYDSDEVLKSCFTNENKTFGGIICADSHRPFIRLTNQGYAVNTGSVGNSIGLPNAHMLLVEGEKDSEIKAPLRLTSLVIPYDNEAEAKITQEYKDLPMKDSYIKEILTGIYSR